MARSLGFYVDDTGQELGEVAGHSVGRLGLEQAGELRPPAGPPADVRAPASARPEERLVERRVGACSNGGGPAHRGWRPSGMMGAWLADL